MSFSRSLVYFFFLDCDFVSGGWWTASELHITSLNETEEHGVGDTHSFHWLSPFFKKTKVTYIHLELPVQHSKVQNLNHHLTISMTFSLWLWLFQQPQAFFPFSSISNCGAVLLEEALGPEDIKPDLGWGLLTHATLWCWSPPLSKWETRLQ